MALDRELYFQGWHHSRLSVISHVRNVCRRGLLRCPASGHEQAFLFLLSSTKFQEKVVRYSQDLLSASRLSIN